MSLLAKFAVLVGVLAAAVIVALGAAGFAVEFSQREARRPLLSMSLALTVLGGLQDNLESQRQLLASDDSSLSPTMLAEGIGRRSQSSAQILASLVAEEWAATVAGKTTLSNLDVRLRELRDLAQTAAIRSDPELTLNAIQQIDATQELIRRTQQRIVADTDAALQYGRGVARRMLSLLAAVLGASLLTCALAYTLLRRWVSGPIGELRTAAARIAAGDFEHRVPVAPFELRRALRGKPSRDELQALSREVNQMAAMVKSLQDERVDRERLAAIGEMVRRLVHNLRTPLAGIRGLAELSRMELADVDNPAKPELVDNQSRIISTVDRFERWLSELLSATRTPQVLPEQTATRQWLTSTVETFRAAAQTANVHLRIEQSLAPDTANFDPRHLEQAVGILISNAIEAAGESSTPRSAAADEDHPTGTVRITSRLVHSLIPGNREPCRTWEILVEDNGPGIPLQLRDKIFQPHFTTKPQGTGIGLAIAVQVVRAHGGSIEVQSPIDRPVETLESSDASSDNTHKHAGNATAERAGGAGFVIRIPFPTS